MSESLLVVAGETSGDHHLARVLRAMRSRGPLPRLWGIGGDAAAAEGVELLAHTRDMAVMGVVEVLRRYGFFRRVFREVLAEVDRRRPAAALLVDYPGFNLRLAGPLKQRGVKVLYYICPQVWAWNRGRIPRMAREVDRLMAIFPFEPDVFAGTGLAVDFVGHPLVADTARAMDTPVPVWGGPGACPVALLPGSRRQEIERIFPVLWQAAGALERVRPDCRFRVAAAGPEAAGWIRALQETVPGGPRAADLVEGQTWETLRGARAAWVTSGTATLETALLGCPMVVVYKTSPGTYLAGRALVRIPHIGMVNLVAGRRLCPEQIQGEATPGALVAAMEPLLDEGEARRTMLEGLDEVRAALGTEKASERVADIVRETLTGG